MGIRSKIIKITDEKIEKILRLQEAVLFNTETEIIFEKHVPSAAFLLISGEITFLKRKRIRYRVSKGQIIGANELLNNKSFTYSAVIKAGSKVIILDRSTLLEVLENNEKDFPDISQILRTSSFAKIS